MTDKRDLELIFNSHFPIIAIETHEEHRAIQLLGGVAGTIGKPIKSWTVTEGLKAIASAGGPALAHERDRFAEYGATPTTEPEAALRAIKAARDPAIFVLLDFHPHLDEPVIIRLLKEIALAHTLTGHRVVLVSHELTLPEELSRHSARLSLSLPDEAKLKKLILDEIKIWQIKNAGQNLRVDKEAVRLLINNLRGLTMTDAQHLVRNAIYDDGAISTDDIPQVAKAKYDLIGQEGALSFEYDTAHFSDLGGMTALKDWLALRRAHFVGAGNPTDLDHPKGILLLGVQGGGKSLAAKAVAGVWGVPLLRLDFGALYNKFFGETEKNVRDALKTAGIMAPCVLWVDEIEKGIATGDYDSGTSRRVLATLLTWMAENKARVFIVATANDIQRLPPELIRKGRLDEIFFVDLPTPPAREEIFTIHLRKRGFDPAQFDLGLLAASTEGFSGAEIEQAVVAARYTAHARKSTLATGHVLSEIKQTKPLSVVMAGEINALRAWAKERTVSAN